MLDPKLRNAIRREIASVVPRVLPMNSPISRLADQKIMGSLRKRHPDLIPNYKIVIGNRVYFLMTEDTKFKGKRRIYTNDTVHNTPKKVLYISYFSKRDLARLLGDDLAKEHLFEQFPEKWILTLGVPASRCKSLWQLTHSIVAFEKRVSKRNRPPETSKTSEWVFGPFSRDFLSHITFTDKIVCTVIDYHSKT